ncbi:MAG TPA: hypothetical protein VKY42_09175 [Trueperaceae bacterium]|nr:hypothetical protein [Trueperaceae bacterium]
MPTAALLAALCAAALLLGGAEASGAPAMGASAPSAAPAPQRPAARLVAVHHQAIAPTHDAPFAAEVTLPPPRSGAWQAVTFETDSACLVPAGLERAAAAALLTLRLDVRGAAGPALAPGETCSGTVVLRFRSASGVEAVAARVAFHRLEAAPYAGAAVSAATAIDRIARGEHGPGLTHPPATYVELAVVNEGEGPVTVVGLAALAELRRLGIESFVLPSRQAGGSLAGLDPIAGDLDVELGPGGTLRLGLVIDPAAAMPQDAGAAAVQPALLVAEDGAVRSLRFDLFTTVWGVAAP